MCPKAFAKSFISHLPLRLKNQVTASIKEALKNRTVKFYQYRHLALRGVFLLRVDGFLSQWDKGWFPLTLGNVSTPRAAFLLSTVQSSSEFELAPNFRSQRFSLGAAGKEGGGGGSGLPLCLKTQRFVSQLFMCKLYVPNVVHCTRCHLLILPLRVGGKDFSFFIPFQWRFLHLKDYKWVTTKTFCRP